MNAVSLAAARTVLAEGMVIVVGTARKLPCMQYDGVMSYSCKLGKCLWSIVIIVGSISMHGGATVCSVGASVQEVCAAMREYMCMYAAVCICARSARGHQCASGRPLREGPVSLRRK